MASRSKAQSYGTLAVAAVKEHAHCVRMMQTSRAYGNERAASQWEEDALREESAAVGFAHMAAYHARSEGERVAQ